MIVKSFNFIFSKWMLYKKAIFEKLEGLVSNMTIYEKVCIDEPYRELFFDLGICDFSQFFSLSGERIKEKDSNKKVERIRIEKRFFYIKKEISKNLFSPSLMNEWKMLGIAEKNGVPCPKRVASGIRVSFPKKVESFLITCEIEGEKLEDLLIKGSIDEKSKLSILENLAEIVKRLHNLKIVHKDLYLCHIVVKKDLSIYLLDFQRAERKRLFYRWMIKDLSALDLFGKRFFRKSERLSFLKRYLGIEKLRKREKALVKKILKREEKMEKHTISLLKRKRELFPNLIYYFGKDIQ